MASQRWFGAWQRCSYGRCPCEHSSLALCWCRERRGCERPFSLLPCARSDRGCARMRALAERARSCSPRREAHVRAPHWWHGFSWPTEFGSARFVRARCLALRSVVCFSRCGPLLELAARLRRAELWTSRWRWPVWWSARRACLHARDRFLHARTHRLGCSALCLRLCLSQRVVWFVLPACS